MEECAETIHRASKVLRHGLGSSQNGNKSNKVRLTEEIIDVLSVLKICTDAGIIPKIPKKDIDAGTKKRLSVLEK